MLWTKNELKMIVKLWDKGKSIREIAIAVGRTEKATELKLRRMSKMNKRPMKRPYRRLADDEKDGCVYHPTCDNCPYPACVHDGYEPGRATLPNPKLKWTKDMVDNLKALRTIYDLPILANIFCCSPAQVLKKLNEIDRKENKCI